MNARSKDAAEIASAMSRSLNALAYLRAPGGDEPADRERLTAFADALDDLASLIDQEALVAVEKGQPCPLQSSPLRRLAASLRQDTGAGGLHVLTNEADEIWQMLCRDPGEPPTS